MTAKDRDRKERQVIRSILPVPVDNQFCHVYLINRLWRVQGSTFIVEFTSTGIASGYMCVLDQKSMKNCEFTVFGYVDICFQYHFNDCRQESTSLDQPGSRPTPCEGDSTGVWERLHCVEEKLYDRQLKLIKKNKLLFIQS